MKILVQDGGFPEHGELLRRHIAGRIDAAFAPGGMTVTLAVDAALGAPESFCVAGAGADWRITGTDVLGLYYGIGRFLHSARWTEGDFAPCATGGTVTPACPFRCIYFSVHFHNWYQEASTPELEAYLEELLLYGYNTIECIIPVVQLYSMEDEMFYQSVAKVRSLFSMAKKLGMKLLCCTAPNQGMISAPREWDADLSYDVSGKYRGWAGRNLCPNKPGALEYLRGIWMRCLEQFTDIGLDYVMAWPYDEGGCGCDKCAPWGAGGFDKLNRVFAADARRLYPDCKFIYATWTFDVPDDQKEYSTLYRRMAAGEMDYIDYLMTDAHGAFPRYPLEHPVIRPIVNFPEISMWGLFPWGGFGANPLPRRFEEFWDSSKAVLSGGAPYSEGLFEDISKVQCVGYYWDKNARYTDTLRQYAEYEFGAGTGEDAVRLMELIEQNHVAVREERAPDPAAAQEALALAEGIDRRLSERARHCWRWRILYIRAMLDAKRYAAFYEKGMTPCYDDLHTLRHDDEEGQVLKDDPEAQALYRELRQIFRCMDRCITRNENDHNASTLPVVQGAM